MKGILSLVSFLVALTLTTAALAGSPPFTAGDLVIYRVGNGEAETNIGNAVYLDEYQPPNPGDAGASLVQSLLVRTNYFGANSPLIASGQSSAEGEITLSTDGRFIVLTGYGATLGQFTNFSLPSTFSTEAPRIVGLVDGNGHVDTTTAQTNSLASAESIRSAASTDGTNLWFSGDTSGIRYTTRGSSLATQLTNIVNNIRQLNIFSNQLYFSTSSSSSIRIGIVTNGLPTTGGSLYTNLPGLPGGANASPYGFVLFNLTGGTNAFDTLYYADDDSFSLSPVGAVYKWSLVSGNWTSNGLITANGARGLTGYAEISGGTTNVHLFSTSGNANSGTGLGYLYPYIDTTGYNANPANSTYGGDANQYRITIFGVNFRGIAFAPQGGEPFPSGPGQISVGPVLGLFSSGLTGCSFPDTLKYSVANLGTDTVSWAASADVDWVSLSATNGSLSSNSSVTVTASFNSNATNLPAGVNTATITFTNTTSALGTTMRAVRLTVNDQTLTPSSDFTTSGQPGGPFSPSNKVYTVRNGSNVITLAVSKTAAWLSLSDTNVSLGACSSTNITVSINTNANALAAGGYADIVSFSNATAGTLIDTRKVNLTAGGIFFCDDFSTFIQNANIDPQQGWVNPEGTANPPYVTNNVVFVPAFVGPASADEPYKNIPLTSNGNVFAAILMTVTSAAPLTTASPSRVVCFFNGQNPTTGSSFPYARDFLSVRDTGGGTQFVFCCRNNGIPANANQFGTNPLAYNMQYKVILQAEAANTNTYVYVNPTSSTLDTNTAYVKMHFVSGVDAAIGAFGLGNTFSSASAQNYQAGVAFAKICITTNFADAYNDINQPAPPPVAYFTGSPTYGGEPLLVTFSDLSTDTSGHRHWNFGDGNTSNTTLTLLTHSYTPGTWNVSLTVTNSAAASSNLTRTAYITVLSHFDWWRSNNFGNVTSPLGDPAADPFGKGMSNTNQFLAGLSPTNANSQLRIISIVPTNATWNQITWKTSGGDTNPGGRTAITNIVQGTTGTTDTKGYTNSFYDISPIMVITPSGDTTTNYVDQGGTNAYYRIRLGP